MRTFEVRRMLYGYAIIAQVAILDDGINVLLAGGEKSHVGAVSFSPNVQTIQLPAHKEGIVSERWAQELHDASNTPVCVQCGIHYNNATQNQIMEIVKLCDEMLTEVRGLL